MGAVRWFVALSVLPVGWSHLFDARDPRQSIIKKTDNILPPLFRFHKELDGDPTASPVPAGPVATAPPLECFQVAEPVLTEAGLTLRGASQPYGNETVEVASTPSCSQVLMVHSFANSYGAPFVGTCPGPPRVAAGLPAHSKQAITPHLSVISIASSLTSPRL